MKQLTIFDKPPKDVDVVRVVVHQMNAITGNYWLIISEGYVPEQHRHLIDDTLNGVDQLVETFTEVTQQVIEDILNTYKAVEIINPNGHEIQLGNLVIK